MIVASSSFRRGMCIVVTRGEVTRGEVVEAALAYFNSHADMDSSGLQATVQELGGGMRKSQAGVVYGDERFKRLMATVGARIGELDSGSLVEMASALSALPGPSTPEVSEVCRKITEIMVKRRDEFKPAGLARIALALACRGSRDPTLIEMVKEDTLSQIEEFSPSELCCILEAHRRWGVHDRELTENVVERLTDEVDRFTAEDLVKTLEVFASLGLARGLLLRRVAALSHDQLPQFTPSQLVKILKSLSKLRFLSTVQINGIMEALGDLRESLRTPRRVSEVVFVLVSNEYNINEELWLNLVSYYSEMREKRGNYGGIQLSSLVDMAWGMCACQAAQSDLLQDIAGEIYGCQPPRNRDILAKMIEVDRALVLEGKGVEAPEAWQLAFAEAQRMEIERSEKSRLHFEVLDALEALKGARGLDVRLNIVRNKKIGGYVVDFFDEETKLVIEIDTLKKPTPLFMKHRHLRQHHNCKSIAIEYWTWRRRNRTPEDECIFLRTLVKEALLQQ